MVGRSPASPAGRHRRVDLSAALDDYFEEPVAAVQDNQTPVVLDEMNRTLIAAAHACPGPLERPFLQP
jgi:hypothetical protein